MNSGVVSLPLGLHFLQEWRLAHALSESGWQIALPEHAHAGIEHLKEYFEPNLIVGEGTPLPASAIGLDTLGPKTTIGTISRPLIVPHQVANYCKGLWPVERGLDFSFVGLNHWGRNSTLSKWHKKSFGKALLPLSVGGSADLDRAISSALAKSPRGGIFVAFSKGGREYPRKVMDNQYHTLLANTKFSLCPDGDQIWSYRFFESVLCGSIPVIQSVWPTYEGFEFYTLEDDVQDMVYDLDRVQRNFEHALRVLTVPHDELSAEIASLLAQA